jgi:hypothetical protein
MPYDIRPISAAQLADALALRDLTDPEAGEHCMQRLVAAATDALTTRWGCRALTWRGERVVDVADNYDRLGYPPDGPRPRRPLHAVRRRAPAAARPQLRGHPGRPA